MSGDCWTLLLAAGGSRRFGRIKALALWNGVSLIRHALAVARMATGERVMVVLGAAADEVGAAVADARTVINGDWAAGMGGSLACGIAAIGKADAEAASVLVMPVDQPLITAAHLQQLAAQSVADDRCVFTGDGTIYGSPAAVPKRLFGAMASLTGEGGLKAVLAAADIGVVENSDALRDADTPEALAVLERLTRTGR